MTQMNEITMVHLNPVRIEGDRLTVDRKFHTGMLRYAELLPRRITTINPKRAHDRRPIMDAVELRLSELPYGVLTVGADPTYLHVGPDDRERLKTQIARSAVVYGAGLGSAPVAKSLGVPYIPILEYDLDTQLRIIGSEVHGFARRAVKSLRCVKDYYTVTAPQMRGAHSVHCNGYPIFDAAEGYNQNRLLYLDSRMSGADVITTEALEERLAGLGERPLRLLYSGRYERLKGADDVVRVAVALLRRGVNVELDCYGQGSLRQEMDELAAGFMAIRIHDPVPFPRLVQISQGMDVFVCCHVQNDPSCTYIEAMGAGLPVVGYANRMWRRLQGASQAGISVPTGDVRALAMALRKLKPAAIREFSHRARDTALEHCFEREFGKRIDAIRAVALETRHHLAAEPLLTRA